MAVFFDGRCACGREVCDFTCATYAAYMSKQNNIGTWQERMKKEPITNADRIRSMSDEELAAFMKPYDSGCPRWEKNPIPCEQRSNCCDCWLDWLRQEIT